MSNIEEIINDNETNVYVARKWLDEKEAKKLFKSLYADIPWGVRYNPTFKVNEPRLSYIIGEPIDGKGNKIVHIYSRIRSDINSWREEDNPLSCIKEVRKLRDRIEEETDLFFDSASLQLYRDGNDWIAHHPDKELKPDYSRKFKIKNNPNERSIYCLSLGETRKFHLKPNGGGKSLVTEVTSGDILVMAGRCQKDYTHSVPKTKKPIMSRISITWRLLGDWE